MSQCRKYVTAALLLASAPLFVHAIAGNFVHIIDRDSGGGAMYGGAPIWVENAASCQAACTADPHCYGWTLNTPVQQSTEGYCYLKSQEKNCEAATLNKVQPPGKYTSGVIADSCTVLCEHGNTVTLPASNCIIVPPTPTSTKAAGRYRRDMAKRKAVALGSNLCPEDLSACPIGTSSTGYECVNLTEELGSCGACGNDCTSIPGVGGVTCSQGRCTVDFCARGYALGIAGGCHKVQTHDLHHYH